MKQRKRVGATIGTALMGLSVLSGCGGGGGSSTPTINTPTLSLVTYTDPWTRATPRWRDITNTEYSAAFQKSFSYAAGSVRLTYNSAPKVPYFTGHLAARGLKPNFAYQLKLAGKPLYGNRGTGTSDSYVAVDSRAASANPITHTVAASGGGTRPINGDDWTNQQLGYEGRWWDDTNPPSTNLDDAYYVANYPAHTIYGYIFLGDIITDAAGNADADIKANTSYHITWQDSQNGIKDTVAGTYIVQSPTAPYYGYGAALPAQSVKLWYEYEAARTHTVQLRPGTYHCRLLLTEEAFHTAGGLNGGVWQTVLASESPDDRNASNDIVFTISAPG